MAATGAPSVWASTSKPAGAVLTATPWLITCPARPGSRRAARPSCRWSCRSCRIRRARPCRRRAERVRHGLEAVADAEHGHAGVEQLGIDARAPGSNTDAGPPDRMMACGSLASISSTGMEWGTSSEYTFASRTRRAMSCAYWAPKSTTSTGPLAWDSLHAAARDSGYIGMGDIVDCGHWYCVDFLQYVTSIVAIRATLACVMGGCRPGATHRFTKPNN